MIILNNMNKELFNIRLAALLIVCIVSAVGIKAQDDGKAQDANKAPAGVAELAQSLGESRRLFAAGRGDEGEAALEGLNRKAKNSGESQLEMAMNLLRVAFDCRESGDIKTAQLVAQRALDRLDRAEAKLGDQSKVVSSINEIRGVIRERLLGNTLQAMALYRESLRKNPDNESVKGKLKQLQGDSAEAKN